MSDAAHLLVPFAASADEGCVAARGALRLPALEKLLARLQPTHTEPGDEHTLSLPHERVLARELGLEAADGCIPWAAWQLVQSGHDPGRAACAWLTPCHWAVGRDHIAMAPPQDLQIGADESRALLDAMRPYFEQDGIALEDQAPTLWLARGEVFRGFASASLDRVTGRIVDPWLPRGDHARPVRRLQQEMQMLLYTHEVNDARIARGLAPVNSFWVSGTGALPERHAQHVPPEWHVVHGLREAAMRQDWAAWAEAWRELDASEIPRLADRVASGEQVAVTLCGERIARTWSGTGGGWLGKLAGALRTPRTADLLEPL